MIRQYGSPPQQKKLSTAKSPSKQAQGSFRAHKQSRFPQARLLVLIVRDIYFSRMYEIVEKIKLQPKRSLLICKVLEKLIKKRKQVSFMEVRLRTKQTEAILEQKVAKKMNAEMFFCHSLLREVRKRYRKGLDKIKSQIVKGEVQRNNLENCFMQVERKIIERKTKKSWEKLIVFAQSKAAIKPKIGYTSRMLNSLAIKMKRLAFQGLVKFYFDKTEEQEYRISQEKRKYLYDNQNNRKKLIQSQRQQLQALKSKIDNFTYERSNKINQFKSENMIKMSHCEQTIKVLSKRLSQAQQQVEKLKLYLQKTASLGSKKQRLYKISQGSQQRFKNLYYSLKDDEGNSSKTKFRFNKEKFSSQLRQYEGMRGKVDQLDIIRNIRLRNSICLYENVPIDKLKLSSEYLLSEEENIQLRQVLSSLFYYHLLKYKGR